MFTVKSKKWYGRWWPPERKRVRLLQHIVNHVAETDEFKDKVNKVISDELIYGKNNCL